MKLQSLLVRLEILQYQYLILMTYDKLNLRNIMCETLCKVQYISLTRYNIGMYE